MFTFALFTISANPTLSGMMPFPNAVKTSSKLTNKSLSFLDVRDLLAVFMRMIAHAKRTVRLLSGQKSTCSGWSSGPSVSVSMYTRVALGGS